MGLKVGIVGLPNVGKSTLFNAITKQTVLAANYPFATIEPNVGIVNVPDERLDKLCELYKPLRRVPTILELTDIAGLVEGASKGEGLGNQFLSHIRECEAICEVVRCFDDDNVIHVTGSVDPVRDIEIISLELIYSDMDVIEKRIPKIEKKAQTKTDKDSMEEYRILKECYKVLEEGKPIRTLSFNKDEAKIIKNFNFLTNKPVIYACNISDEEISDYSNNEYIKKVKELASKENSLVTVISAKLEADLAELSDEEKNEFLSEMGITNSGLDDFIKTCYSLLGLKTFFTSGADECRAWTFRNGMKAPECAGIIHSDFERGFIKAEVFSYDDLMKYGTEQKVKEVGLYRIEGKEYVVKDGDIIFFRFNV